MRSTHSLATLSISEAAYTEIKNKLLAASYHSQILKTVTSEMIDMHGIALVVDEGEVPLEPGEDYCCVCRKATRGSCMNKPLCEECYTSMEPTVIKNVQEELAKKDKNYLVKELEIDEEAFLNTV